MVVVGADVHKRSRAFVAVDEVGRGSARLSPRLPKGTAQPLFGLTTGSAPS